MPSFVASEATVAAGARSNAAEENEESGEEDAGGQVDHGRAAMATRRALPDVCAE